MQKSFTCKAHLQILPPCVLFPYYIFPSATQVSSCSFFHVVHLLPAAHWLASRQEPLGLEHQGQVKVLCSAPHTGPWELRAEQQTAGLADPAARSSLWQASEGPLPPDYWRDPLDPRNPWSSSSAHSNLFRRKAPCCRLSSCQLRRPGIGMPSFTRPS